MPVMPISPILAAEIAVVYVSLCFLVAFLGRNRRIGFWGFFFVSLIFTPLLTPMFIFFAAPAKE